YPAKGAPYDLHSAAQEWLEAHGFYDPNRIGLSRDRVYFELTRPEKVNRIVQTGCSFFIDDLPEVLLNPAFPVGVQRILFDPHGQYAAEIPFHRAVTWTEIEQLIRCNEHSN